MLHNRFGCQLAILVLLSATAEAQASSKPSEAELAAITVRGVLLAEYDTAAWQATDAVQAAHPVEGRVGRYIGRKTDAGWVVDFGRLNQAQDRFLVAYEAASVARTCYAGPRLSSSNPRALIRLAKAHHAEVKRAGSHGQRFSDRGLFPLRCRSEVLC